MMNPYDKVADAFIKADEELAGLPIRREAEGRRPSSTPVSTPRPVPVPRPTPVPVGPPQSSVGPLMQRFLEQRRSQQGPQTEEQMGIELLRSLVLQRRFKEGCAGRHEVRRGAWHGSAWPVRYYPASLPATAATQPARTVPWAAIPAPPGRPAAS